MTTKRKGHTARTSGRARITMDDLVEAFRLGMDIGQGDAKEADLRAYARGYADCLTARNSA